MAKAKIQTEITGKSVKDFLDSISDEDQRKDSLELSKLIGQASGEKPKMWGPVIVGFGSRPMKYASGREIDWMCVGFSPRKGKLTLYGLKKEELLLKKLGKFKVVGGCIYIKNLSDVNKIILKKLIVSSIKK